MICLSYQPTRRSLRWPLQVPGVKMLLNRLDKSAQGADRSQCRAIEAVMLFAFRDASARTTYGVERKTEFDMDAGQSGKEGGRRTALHGKEIDLLTHSTASMRVSFFEEPPRMAVAVSTQKTILSATGKNSLTLERILGWPGRSTRCTGVLSERIFSS